MGHIPVVFWEKMLISVPFRAILMKVCKVYQVVISKYHRLRDLKQPKIISHRLESGKSKIKMPADLRPGEHSPGLRTAAFFCTSQAFLCALLGREESSMLASLLIRKRTLSNQGPLLWPHLTLITSVKVLSPNSVRWGWGFPQVCEGRNTHLQSITWSCTYLCLYRYIHSKSSKYYTVLSYGFLSNLPIFMNMSTSRYGLFSFGKYSQIYYFWEARF